MEQLAFTLTEDPMTINDLNVDEPLTFGQKAVGLTFNPSGDSRVEECKLAFADIIDALHALRMTSKPGSEQGRLASIAITDAQTAQMWAVKALTWVDDVPAHETGAPIG